MRTVRGLSVAVAVAAVAAGCGRPPELDPVELVVPETYAFTERETSASTVSYSGQVLRNVLISDMKAHLSKLTARIDSGGAFVPVGGEVKAELEFFYKFDGATSGNVKPLLDPKAPVLQATYAEIGSANLSGKIAGKDEPAKQHQDWSTQFKGWSGASSPDALVNSWLAQLDAAAVARASGNIPLGPDGVALPAVHLTAEGLALHELLQKFLTGAVNYSQAADDYLDEGLSSDNTAKVSGKPYTELEHQWDEGFGYFGAARDYLQRTDEQVATAPGFDTDGDGKIDLASEMNFDHAGYAAKRDRTSATTSAPTDFSGDAMRAFLKGRAIIDAAEGALTEAQRVELTAARDQALGAWEKAIAASAIHYLNEVLKDMEKFGTTGYSFSSHAAHFSEMKGFALSLQFNPRKKISQAEFDLLHAKVKDAPVLANQAGIPEYKAALLEAREILKTAYGFDPVNVGDSVGANGW